MRRAVTAAAIVLSVVILAALGAFAWLKVAPRRVPAGQPPLATLGAGSLAGFKASFNTAKGDIRILALLSPT